MPPGQTTERKTYFYRGYLQGEAGVLSHLLSGWQGHRRRRGEELGRPQRLSRDKEREKGERKMRAALVGY
jgi:hypothetical protein